MGNLTPCCVFCGGHGNKILSVLASRKLRQVVRSSALMTLSDWIKGAGHLLRLRSTNVCRWSGGAVKSADQDCGSGSLNIKRPALMIFGQTFLLFSCCMTMKRPRLVDEPACFRGEKCIQLMVPPGQQGRSASLWNVWGWIKLNHTGFFN